jgi:hypothetical protein
VPVDGQIRIQHPGSSPDLSQTGDMFERMVAFVGEHVRA